MSVCAAFAHTQRICWATARVKERHIYCGMGVELFRAGLAVVGRSCMLREEEGPVMEGGVAPFASH